MKKWGPIIGLCALCACQGKEKEEQVVDSGPAVTLSGPMTAPARQVQGNMEKIAQQSVKKSDDFTKRFNEEMKDTQVGE